MLESPTSSDPLSYRFDRYELRPSERALRAGGEPVKLGGRAFDMLVALVERHDRVVGKRELMDIVWPKLVVEENNLQAQVVSLRKLLGPAAIATIPGRGYRLTLPVQTIGPQSAATAQLDADVATTQRHNLPRGVEPLIGRERETAKLLTLLADHRLVTVTGPGGVGKSRLVLDAAWACHDRYPDGVWWVELAALADAALVCSAVTTALGVAVPPAADPQTALMRQLGQRRLLLVLDNCEHVVESVAALLETLLAAAPNMHALISSQELIGIAGEHVLRLPSLPVPAETAPTAAQALASGAVRLFTARTQAADPNFELNDRVAPTVAAICRRLDGIPLAIEMAAARVPLLGLDGLHRRLDERFRVLMAGKRNALPRQRTLQATLDWSHSLLSPVEQTVFRRIGVFAGPFTLAAAAQLAVGDDAEEFDAIEALAGLCDKSLVNADAGLGDTRYRLLETARVYALDKLAAAGETSALMRRYAQYVRSVFTKCFDDWIDLSDAAFRARYAPELDNLRAALGWAFGPDGDGTTAIALAGSSSRLWISLSLYNEADQLMQRAADRMTDETPSALRADVLFALASLFGQRNQQATIKAASASAEIYRQLGDKLRLACALHSLANAHSAERDKAAEGVLNEALPLLRASGRTRLLAMSHGALSMLHGARGEAAQAIQEAQTALDLWRAAGADAAVLRAMVTLADQVWSQGKLERAIELAEDVLARLEQSPFADRISHLYARANQFGMLVERGELGKARPLGRELLPELAELSIAHGWSDHFASCLARSGQVAAAVRLVGWADALRLAKGLRRQSNEQRARTFVLDLASRADDLDVDRLLGEGAALSGDDAVQLATP